MTAEQVFSWEGLRKALLFHPGRILKRTQAERIFQTDQGWTQGCIYIQSVSQTFCDRQFMVLSAFVMVGIC